MTVLNFLTSPDGVLLEHAIVLLCVAIVGYFTAKVHAQTKAVEEKLNGHMAQLESHVLNRAASGDNPPPAATSAQ